MPETTLILALALHTLLAAAVGFAAYGDLRRRRIPNWLTLSLAIAGLLAAGPRVDLTLAQSAAGMGIGLLIPFVLFALGMLGAGDVKLLAAIGAWMGPADIVLVLLCSAMAGGVLAMLVALATRQIGSTLRNTALVSVNLVTTRQTGFVPAAHAARSPELRAATLPYALAILVGLLATQGMLILRAVSLG